MNSKQTGEFQDSVDILGRSIPMNESIIQKYRSGKKSVAKQNPFKCRRSDDRTPAQLLCSLGRTLSSIEHLLPSLHS